MAKKTWFNWNCPHCNHRHRTWLPQQFEMSKTYVATWPCEECGVDVELRWSLNVTGWLNQKKPPKMRKRKREKKKLKRDEDYGTKKDQAYINDHGDHR